MNLKLTSPFLAEKGGYTASKANFLANVIKNISATTDSQLTNHVLVAKKIEKEVDSKTVEVDYVHVTPSLSVDQIIALAQKEGKYYAVSAWLREGIKAKESILDGIRNSPASAFVPMPVLPTYTLGLVEAHNIYVPDEEEYSLVIDKFSVAERAEYLTLEAEAAWIGKRIHSQTGLFNQWRKQAVNFKPVEFLTPNPTKSLMITNTLRLSVEDIDLVLLALQGAHRTVESKLNSFKSRLKTMVHEMIQVAQAKRTDAENAMRNALVLYQTDQRNATAQAEIERSKMLVTASKLGIIIPKMHEAILKEVEKSINYTPDEAFGADNEVG